MTDPSDETTGGETGLQIAGLEHLPGVNSVPSNLEPSDAVSNQADTQ